MSICVEVWRNLMVHKTSGISFQTSACSFSSYVFMRYLCLSGHFLVLYMTYSYWVSSLLMFFAITLPMIQNIFSVFQFPSFDTDPGQCLKRQYISDVLQLRVKYCVAYGKNPPTRHKLGRCTAHRRDFGVCFCDGGIWSTDTTPFYCLVRWITDLSLLGQGRPRSKCPMAD